MTKKVQVAFQGGGAKIFALIGAVKALRILEEKDIIEVTRVAGSSAGSIVASCFAFGMTADEICELFTEPPVGFKKISRIKSALKILFRKPIFNESLLEEIFGKLDIFNKRIEEADIPLIITSSNLQTGEQIIYRGETTLKNALLKSCRIPFALGPNTLFSNEYDGGVTGNLPIYHLVDKINDYGKIIAITFENKKQPIKGIFDLLKRTMFSAIESNVNLEISRNGLFVLKLDDHGIETIEFEKLFEIMKSRSEENSIYKKSVSNSIKSLESELKEKNFDWFDVENYYKNLKRTFPKVESHSYRKILFDYSYGPLKKEEFNSDNSVIKPIKKALEEYKYYKFPNDEYFDAFQKPELALMNEVVYLFPFFLSKLRKNYWGVLKYGQHRALGLMLANQSERIENGFSIDDNFFETHDYLSNKTNVQNLTENIGKNHWIDDLIKEIEKNNGSLISFAGYLFDEIIPLMFIESHQFSLMDDFRNIKYEVYPQEVLRNVATELNHYRISESEKEEIICRELINKADDNFPFNAVIFDLAYKDTLLNILKSENKDVKYQTFDLLHYLDIPVGIGFTLTTLDNFKHFWDNEELDVSAFALEHKDKFESQGIEITIKHGKESPKITLHKSQS